MRDKLYRLSPVYKKFQKIDEEYETLLPQDERISDRLELTDLGLANQTCYLRMWGGFPVYQNTDVQYFSDGNRLMEEMKKCLGKAQKFIFLEWHKIEDTVIWKGIEEVLHEKAEAGVEVRVMTDGIGSYDLKKDGYEERLKEEQIRFKIFHEKNFSSKWMDYRDFRKTLVVDGRYAFTGDFELTNEQFDLVDEAQKGRKWKISGLKLTGDAVRNCTYSFLKMWNVSEQDSEDPIPYLLKTAYRSAESGYVLPFASDPMKEERLGIETYLNLIRNARKYIYLSMAEKQYSTDIQKELIAAAKRGVKLILVVSDEKKQQAGLQELTAAGKTRIFLYKSGRLAVRQIIADDQVAIVGNIRLDKRESERNFENAFWIAGTRAVLEAKRDVEKLLPYCEELLV